MKGYTKKGLLVLSIFILILVSSVYAEVKQKVGENKLEPGSLLINGILIPYGTEEGAVLAGAGEEALCINSDFNRNGEVNFLDSVSLMLLAKNDPNNPRIDYNKDGSYSGVDVASFLLNLPGSISCIWRDEDLFMLSLSSKNVDDRICDRINDNGLKNSCNHIMILDMFINGKINYDAALSKCNAKLSSAEEKTNCNNRIDFYSGKEIVIPEVPIPSDHDVGVSICKQSYYNDPVSLVDHHVIGDAEGTLSLGVCKLSSLFLYYSLMSDMCINGYTTCTLQQYERLNNKGRIPLKDKQGNLLAWHPGMSNEVGFYIQQGNMMSWSDNSRNCMGVPYCYALYFPMDLKGIGALCCKEFS